MVKLHHQSKYQTLLITLIENNLQMMYKFKLKLKTG